MIYNTYNIPNDNKPNYPFCKSKSLAQTNSLKPTNQSSIKVPKVFKPMNNIVDIKHRIKV